MVLRLHQFPVIALSNTSWAKLEYTISFNEQLGKSTYVDLVPLKCHTGGICAPLLAEEKALQTEVSWGTIRARSVPLTAISENKELSLSLQQQVRSFEFLTSNFGSQLPVQQQPVRIALADPSDGCTPLVSSSDILDSSSSVVVDTTAGLLTTNTLPSSSAKDIYYSDAAVLINRGGCRFDIKVLHAQAAGARMVVVVDVDDNALQRIGGMHPESGYVGIPSIIVTAPAGAYLRNISMTRQEYLSLISSSATEHAAVATTASLAASIEVIPSRDSTGADQWIELAYTQWAAPVESDDSNNNNSSNGNEEETLLLLQLEGLIQKYSQSGSAEIVAWLHRKRDRIVNRGLKSIDTDYDNDSSSTSSSD